MPIVTKQSNKKAPKRQSVLDRVRDVGPSEKGIKLLVYGRGKTGKTRLASTFPKPCLILGTEDGTLSVSNVKGLKFVDIRASEDIDEVAESIPGNYKSVCLDTAGGLQDIILKEILGLEDIPVQKTWGIAKQQDWGTCGAQTKERLRTILNLADRHAIHVVVIAHERSFDVDEDLVGVFPTIGAALTPSVAGWLNAACDYIGQTYMRPGTIMKKVTVGKKTILKPIRTGKIEYCLRVGPHEVYTTGFRVASGIELPDDIVDPTYEKIASLIRGVVE